MHEASSSKQENHSNLVIEDTSVLENKVYELLIFWSLEDLWIDERCIAGRAGGNY